ncbi:MAG: hypothetical protein K9G76_05305 [Bacteroidales bacterium]|nr:hypothetical protein [Bacteroidales bacterium]MCF8403096.1 hypothetical protein [Bacteroidales bacterium]
MKKLVFIVFLMALIAGCAKDKEETPEPVLTPQELILGEWDCTSWTMEGAEIMGSVEYYTMGFFMEADAQTFEFEYRTNTDGVKWRGIYAFEEEDTKLKTTYVSQWFWNGSDWQATAPEQEKTWTIEKLTSGTLQLGYITSAQNTDYHFLMTLKK